MAVKLQEDASQTRLIVNRATTHMYDTHNTAVHCCTKNGTNLSPRQISRPSNTIQLARVGMLPTRESWECCHKAHETRRKNVVVRPIMRLVPLCICHGIRISTTFVPPPSIASPVSSLHATRCSWGYEYQTSVVGARMHKPHV